MKGLGVSPGIAIGKVIVKKDPKIEIVKRNIDDVQKEVQRLKDALAKSKNEIKTIYDKSKREIGEKEAGIFEAHIMILDDPEMFEEIEKKIKDTKVNAEWALKEVSDLYIEIFKNMDNEYMRERVADIEDVSLRVIRNLLGLEFTDLYKLEEEVIIVAEDLSPSDTAQMDKEKVIGFVTKSGGKTSHSAIMARTLEIPAVVGVGKEIEGINTGDILVFDGDKGTIIVNPDKKILEKYIKKKREYESLRERLKSLIGKESMTMDGFKVELSANIGTPDDVDAIIRNDGEGIGLYRTEFLYMDRDRLPSEEEQFEAYKVVAERMKRKPVVIRTLDIGGDKKLSYMDLPEEMNPFLGYRAIRICLDRKDIFKTQLRAILRASAYGNIKIMFPMISSIEELRKAKEIFNEVREGLRKDDISFNEDMEVGIMIEIPAAAIISDIFAKEVDFFSIGTNDLIQYTTAVDRGNKDVAYLYNQYHPALLRLINNVIVNGHKEGIWVGMCGEVAGDVKMIPLLIGMGLDEFSVSPGMIPEAKKLISSLRLSEARELARTVLAYRSAEDIRSAVKKVITRDVPRLLQREKTRLRSAAGL